MSLRVAVEKALGHFALDADFTSEGQVTALFGHSGSGKTTLVNLIAGLIKPDRGRIEVEGEVLCDTERGINVPAQRRRVGYVFQEGRLFPHLSVRHNLLYGRWLTRREDRWGAFDQIVDLLGIGALLDRRPRTLSGGEKQRVAIGRALLASPRLLLLDEPLAALDEARKEEILPYIERLRDEMRLPIVYVSHAVEEVARIADTLVLLATGKVIASGSVNDILTRLDLKEMSGLAEASAVLTALVISHDRETGMTLLDHPAGRLSVPLIDAPPGTPIRVRVRGRDVSIAVGDPGNLSIRNRLAATLTEIAEGPPPNVEIRLDAAGSPLIARITIDALHGLGLKVGQPVTALIKSASFDRLSLGAGKPR